MNLKALVILKVHSPDNENPIENVDSVEVLMQILLTRSKQSDAAVKRDLMKTPSYIIYVKVILIAM